jgi:hypothetical protein
LQQSALLQPLQIVLPLPHAPLYIKLAALAVMPKQTLISHVTRLKSQTTRHTSQVTRHTSHVTRHTSHVTCSNGLQHELTLAAIAMQRATVIES